MSFENLVVLVVDDLPYMREVISFSLRDLGFRTILSAENGLNAVKILQTRKIHLIVSDWNMPFMDGLALLNWVRSQAETATIPFLMITAEANRKAVMKAVEARVSSYVVKPFTSRILAEKIGEILPCR